MGAGERETLSSWHAGALWALLPLTTSCSLPTLVWIPPPEAQDPAAIVALIQQSSRLTGQAFTPPGPLHLGLIDPGEDAVSMTLHYYAQPLAALGLSAGRIAGSARGRSCDLRSPTEVWTSELRGAEATEWQRTSLSPELLELLLPNRPECISRCVTFRQVTVPLPRTGRVSGMVALDARTVLIAGIDGRMFLVRRDGGEVEPVDAPPGTTPRVLFRGEDGELWIATKSGRLLRGHLDEGFRMVTTSTGQRISAIAGGPEPYFGLVVDELADDTEFTIAVDRYEGTEAARIFEMKANDGNERRATWATRQPGSYLGSAATDFMLTIENGDLQTIPNSAITSFGLIETVGWFEGFGFVAATNAGPIFHTDEPFGAWSLIGSDLFRTPAGVLLPIDRGFIAAAEIGEVRQYQPDEPPCAPFAVRGTEPTIGAVVGDALALSGSDDGDANAIVFLEPMR